MIDSSVRIYGAELKSADDTHRVDAFCVITGNVWLGRRVHVASGCRLLGSSGRIVLGDASAVSMGSTLLTATDDYVSGHAMGPTIPDEYRNVTTGNVILEPFAVVGAHSVVMPGVTLGWGAAVGACSFVNCDIPAGEVWAGVPARRIGSRNMLLLREIAGKLGIS